jgi:hypothetical protein
MGSLGQGPQINTMLSQSVLGEVNDKALQVAQTFNWRAVIQETLQVTDACG